MKPAYDIQNQQADVSVTFPAGTADLDVYCHALTKFHTKYMFNLATGNAELQDAIYMLESAMAIMRGGASLKVVEFHMQRVGTFSIGDAQLEEQLEVLRACIDFLRR